ncbi:MAG: (4Fe-4S)-binding protein [Methanobacteriota archaeon]|nr:MAG: (4Fe-4S)-binding protein [Euryarchaeota archaeon]
MIRCAVISGKGGTGKTVVTAALAYLLPQSKVLADCDVDAANLGILLAPKLITATPFFGMNAAVIDPGLCTRCGSCAEHCRFGAVEADASGCYRVNALRCEGCAVCTEVRPAGAITMKPRVCGEIYLSSTPVGTLSHARLFPGAGNSGLLVHEVKKQALQQDDQVDMLLMDGPPGIGCPLISTITGTDAVLIVTEPSVAGLHDLGRVVGVARRYAKSIFVAINRFDIDEHLTKAVEAWCTGEGIPLIGRIPFDPQVIASVRNCTPISR